jgi:high-affinity nickel-transport protein
MRPALAGLGAANLLAWAWALAIFGGHPTLLGTAMLAWTFGLRHALDADHIAAIDNVVRRLVAGGRPGAGLAGLFFSLGHSSIVVLACVVIGVAAGRAGSWMDEAHALGGIVGTSVSAAFLLLIAAANMLILRGVWRRFQHVRAGGALDDGAGGLGAGPLGRLFAPLLRGIARPWQMYPLGVLFGLGFDTATEVGLLGISATQAMAGLAPWQILVFPALFTAGMTLVDTADSLLMVRAYGWAQVHPLRKLWYNLTITGASVLVAVLIGGVEALGLIGARFGLSGGFWSVIARLNDNLGSFGLAVVALFVLSWLVSALVYRLKGYDRVVPVDG